MGCRAHSHKRFFFFCYYIYIPTNIHPLLPSRSSTTSLPRHSNQTQKMHPVRRVFCVQVVLFHPPISTLQPDTRAHPIGGCTLVSGYIPSTRTPPTCPNRHIGGVSRFSTPPSSQTQKCVFIWGRVFMSGYIPSKTCLYIT